MAQLAHNPAGLLAVTCLVGVAVIANLALVALLRGFKLDLTRWQRSLNKEADIWKRAVAGGQAAQRQQTDQLNELHSLVGQLPENPPNHPEPPVPPQP